MLALPGIQFTSFPEGLCNVDNDFPGASRINAGRGIVAETDHIRDRVLAEVLRMDAGNLIVPGEDDGDFIPLTGPVQPGDLLHDELHQAFCHPQVHPVCRLPVAYLDSHPWDREPFREACW